MKIPKYIHNAIATNRLVVAPTSEQDAAPSIYGYVFRLYLRNNHTYLKTLLNEGETICQWARRNHSESFVIEHFDVSIGYDTPFFTFTKNEHQKPYYKRDYILLAITDPCAYCLEKLIKENKSKRH